MPGHSDACRASARRCAEIAEKTRTLDDRCEFLCFAASWQRLANEIECSERLITLIDELVASTPASEDADRTFDELTECHSSSLRRLATAMLSASHHFMADYFATPNEVEESGSSWVAAEFGPVKQGSE